MRFNLSFVVCLMFFALLGTVVVALIIQFDGPPEISPKLVPRHVSDSILILKTTTTGEKPDSSLEEEAEPEIDKQARTPRQLPDDYMTTLELYRNRLRIGRGEELKKLTAQDFREGYGLYKIPSKAEIQKQLARGLDKN